MRSESMCCYGVAVYLYKCLQLNLTVKDTTLPLLVFLLSSKLLKFRRGEPLIMRQDARRAYSKRWTQRETETDRQTDRHKEVCRVKAVEYEILHIMNSVINQSY